MIKGVVVAGNFREYVVWFQENEKNRSEYLYVADDTYDTMKKLPLDTPLYLVGTYRDNFMYRMVRERFPKHRMDKVNLGFSADPRQWRYFNEEGLPPSEQIKEETK